MRTHQSINAKAWALACFFVALPLSAPQAQDPVLRAFEAPAETNGIDLTGLAKAARSVEENYPVTGAPEVSISNTFGRIEVDVWDNRVVRVVAQINVGAETPAAAAELLRQVEVEVLQKDNRLAIATHTPEVCECTIDFKVDLPRDASVLLDNFFGDTFVTGVEGNVVLDSRYGIVGLEDIEGTVRVRAKGEFLLTARRLAQGGVFVLRGARAVFTQVSGDLRVNNYLGSVEVRASGDAVNVDITNESGAIYLYVPEGSLPNIEATATYGAVESQLPVRRNTWAHVVRTQSVGPESAQRFVLHTSFNTVYIGYDEVQESSDRPAPGGEEELVQGTTTETYPAPEGTALSVEAISGDILVEGVDTDTLTVTATRHIRLRSMDNARLVLEGLAFRVNQEKNLIRVQTAVQDDLEALGCTSHRVDITIQCPRTVPITIHAERGRTSVVNTGGAIVIVQAEGTINIEHAKGALNLVNRNGGIEIENCAGPVFADGTHGTLTLRNIYGDIDLVSRQGKAIIDTPHAALKVRSHDGDVHIIALEGVEGDYDIVVDKGDLSMVVPATADATFLLTARGGVIRSAIPVTGAIDRGAQTFQGRLNGGTHRVFLETRSGNIVLD